MRKIIITVLFGFSALLILSCETDIDSAAADGEPEIEVSIDGFNIADNGGYNLGDVERFDTRKIIGTIKNEGTADLNIDGDIIISGDDASLFTITAQPDTPIAAGESSVFEVLLSTSDTNIGSKAAALSITGNESDEPSLTIALTAETTDRVWTAATLDADWKGRRYFSSLVFDNKIWVLGGESYQMDSLSDVWCSSDGKTWIESASEADWYGGDNKLSRFESIVFQNKIWIFGGFFWDDCESSSDIWCSEDGLSWNKVSSNADFNVDTNFETLVFDNKLWIMGGSNGSTVVNEVWYSNDGTTWNKTDSNAGWCARKNFGSLVYDDKIWILGGDNGEFETGSVLNDIWYSDDGISWIRVTESAEWPARKDFGTVVYDDKIWVFGGYKDTYENYRFSDVWYSTDGITWTEATSETNCCWETLGDFQSVIYNNRIWVLGGDVQLEGAVNNASHDYSDEVYYW